MGNPMAKIYVSLISKGLKTLEETPPELREEVERLLKEDGK